MFVGVTAGCDLFNSSLDKPDFKVRFKTDKNAYQADSTYSRGNDTISATFINQSNQSLFLIYRGCLLGSLEKMAASKWKTVTIPVVCIGVVRGPVKVKPGQSKQVGINLGWWAEPVKPLQSGVYRFTLYVSKPDLKKPVKVVSNQFKISY